MALISGREEFQPYDLLVASIPETNEIDETAWLYFFEAADPEQALSMGALAFGRSQSEAEIDWGGIGGASKPQGPRIR